VKRLSQKSFEVRRDVSRELDSLRRLATQRRLAALRGLKRMTAPPPQQLPLAGK
jgi:hypothetical protein